MEFVKVSSFGETEFVAVDDYLRGWMDATDMDEMEAAAVLFEWKRDGGYFKGLMDGKSYADYFKGLENAGNEEDDAYMNFDRA